MYFSGDGERSSRCARERSPAFTGDDPTDQKLAGDIDGEPICDRDLLCRVDAYGDGEAASGEDADIGLSPTLPGASKWVWVCSRDGGDDSNADVGTDGSAASVSASASASSSPAALPSAVLGDIQIKGGVGG